MDSLLDRWTPALATGKVPLLPRTMTENIDPYGPQRRYLSTTKGRDRHRAAQARYRAKKREEIVEKDRERNRGDERRKAYNAQRSKDVRDRKRAFSLIVALYYIESARIDFYTFLADISALSLVEQYQPTLYLIEGCENPTSYLLWLFWGLYNIDRRFVRTQSNGRSRVTMGDFTVATSKTLKKNPKP